MERIQCFIACRFGKKDIDDLYEGAIIIALDKLNIKGLRVDKINHNEKIDIKILDLIANSQFGIADLTYARPSVYFEAGFLEGQNKPVIYLAREDHFSSKVDDEYGNFKIHFDLITKNIIPWGKINNKLIEDIKRRISLIIKPIQRKLAEENKIIKAKKAFSELSIIDRIDKLRSLSLGFISRNFKSNWYIEKRQREISVITHIDGKKCFLNILIGETFSKNDILYFRPGGPIWHTHWKEPYKNAPNIIVFIVSLRAIRFSTIESGLPFCRKFGGSHYQEVYNQKNYYYFIIDNIDIDFMLKPRLLGCIDVLKNSNWNGQ
jgi:hypothetical protein